MHSYALLPYQLQTLSVSTGNRKTRMRFPIAQLLCYIPPLSIFTNGHETCTSCSIAQLQCYFPVVAIYTNGHKMCTRLHCFHVAYRYSPYPRMALKRTLVRTAAVSFCRHSPSPRMVIKQMVLIHASLLHIWYICNKFTLVISISVTLAKINIQL